MKTFEIEFILKIQEGNSYKLQQQIITIDANNKKEALINAKKKIYIPRNYIKIDHYQFN
jgi:hypothetical protein